MDYLFFPGAKGVRRRLNARFPTGAADLNAHKAAVTAALGDTTTPQKVQDAVAVMRSAIAAFEGGNEQARLEYLRGAADLQVSKGGGLLAFTAIIAGIAGVAFEKLHADLPAATFCLLAGGIALLASVLALFVIWSYPPSEEQFKTAANEASWLAGVLALRGVLVNLAVFLSGIATICLVIAVWVFVAPESPLDGQTAPPAEVASAPDVPPG